MSMYDDFTREQLIAEILRWKEQTAKNARLCMRYETALKLARQFGIHSREYDSDPSKMIADWMDAGMHERQLPWPSSPFAQDWLKSEGYSDCSGKIGMRATMTIVPQTTN